MLRTTRNSVTRSYMELKKEKKTKALWCARRRHSLRQKHDVSSERKWPCTTMTEHNRKFTKLTEKVSFLPHTLSLSPSLSLSLCLSVPMSLCLSVPLCSSLFLVPSISLPLLSLILIRIALRWGIIRRKNEELKEMKKRNEMKSKEMKKSFVLFAISFHVRFHVIVTILFPWVSMYTFLEMHIHSHVFCFNVHVERSGTARDTCIVAEPRVAFAKS